jgi:hypothetical protein
MWLLNYLLTIFIGLNIPFIIRKEDYIEYYIIIPNILCSLLFLILLIFHNHITLKKYQIILIYINTTLYWIWNFLYIIYLSINNYLIDTPQYFYLVLIYINLSLIVGFILNFYRNTNFNNILPINFNQI